MAEAHESWEILANPSHKNDWDLARYRYNVAVGTPRAPHQLPNGRPYNLTTTLAFDQAGPPTWHFVKRWNHNEFLADRTSQPLAADGSAPNAFFWEMCQLDDLTIQSVILPDHFMEETGGTRTNSQTLP